MRQLLDLTMFEEQSQMENHFSLLDNYPAFALPALRTSGATVIDRLGMDVVKDVILDVLSGRNIRDSTEILTRRRITTVNLGLVSLFLSALARYPDDQDTLVKSAKSVIKSSGSTKEERNIAQWVIGLTDKSVQNVLRDDTETIDDYAEAYVGVTEDVASQFQNELGDLLSPISGLPSNGHSIDWSWIAHLANAVGTSTLSIRGSDKSTYGKLFEKLILGSLLEVLGYRFHPGGEERLLPGRFILSSRGARRESDATLLLRLGDAIRFDIGFIGRGNTEISLDKVTRFETEAAIAGQSRYVTTIIIVDRIGTGSRIPELARGVGGHIVQMSGSYWPRSVARLIGELTGIYDQLGRCPPGEVPGLLEERLNDVDLAQFL